MNVGECHLAHRRATTIRFIMRAAHVRRYVTAAEFLESSAAAGSTELVRGEVRSMIPASAAHGVVAGTIFAAISAYAESAALGVCFPDNTGFLLPGLGDTVRSPDASFIAADKIPAEGFGTGWLAAAPDLVVEVLSPSETASELEAKLRDYFSAGTRLAWVVDVAHRSVGVRSSAEGERSVSIGDTLEGGVVLPGFAIPVERLFARVARSSGYPSPRAPENSPSGRVGTTLN